jgi:hypothetical protein
MAVVAVLLTAASCTMPDFQLNTDLTATVNSASSPPSALVSYRFDNVGNKDLKNVQVFIQVTAYESGGGSYTTPSSTELGPFSIDANDYVHGTETVYLAPGTYMLDGSVSIVSIGWDDGGDSGWN